MAEGFRAQVPTILVFLFGAALLLFGATRPIETLVVETLPDDAFYYFQIARNIAEGDGSTFDGTVLTNGYHPLWMLTIVPLWKFFSDGGLQDVAPIHAALFLSIGLALLAAMLLFLIVRRYTTDPRIRAFAVFFFLCNPFVIYAILSGLETSLALFLLAALIYLATEQGVTPSRFGILAIGTVSGLLMLARLDALFYVLAYLSWLAWMRKEEMFVCLRTSFFIGIIASVIVAPYLFWNVNTFHMLLTSASEASTLVNHHLVYQDNGEGLFVLVKTIVYMFDRGVRAAFEVLGFSALLIFLVGAVFALERYRFNVRLILNNMTPVHALFLGGMLHLLVSACVRWTFRDWYFIPLTLFVAMFVAWALARIREHNLLPHIALPILFAVTAGVFFIAWDKQLEHREFLQKDMLAVAQWENEHLPAGSVIGVFNAGVHGYFSKHKVVNLDGLVNNDVLAALKERKVWEYAVQEAKITHLSDFELYPSYRFRGFLGDSFPEKLPVLYTTREGGIVVWQVPGNSK